MTYLSLAILLLGHGCLWILVVNLLHGAGIPGHWPNRITYAMIPMAIASTLALIVGGIRADWWSWSWPAAVYAATCVGIGLIGLPIVTLVRLLRRDPPGIRGEVTEVDLAARLGVETLIGHGPKSRMLRLPGHDSFRLVSSEWSVELPGLPRSLDQLSLIHLTDLHLAPWHARAFFEAVMDEAAGWDADLVVITGDLLEDESVRDWVEPVLGRVRGRLGTYAILGNHDLFCDLPPLRRAIEAAGVIDLDGRWTSISIGEGRLTLGGTCAPWGPPLDPATRPEGDCTIVLSHTPDRFPGLARMGVDLVLSGHNHGGQIRLPGIGPVLMPSIYSRRYDQGWFSIGDSRLFVGRGIGGANPLRYNCPIEISRITLRVPGAARTGPFRAARQGSTAGRA
ncbi:MAG: metallophosphoesterase [Isosphaeraceae bacterium]